MMTNLVIEAAGDAVRGKMIADVVESAGAGSTNGILADRASRTAWPGGRSAVAERALNLLRSWWIAAAAPTTAEEKEFLIEI